MIPTAKSVLLDARQRVLTIKSFLSPEHGGPQREAIKKLIENGELVIHPGRPKQYFA